MFRAADDWDTEIASGLAEPMTTLPTPKTFFQRSPTQAAL